MRYRPFCLIVACGSLLLLCTCKRQPAVDPPPGEYPVHLLGRFNEAAGYWEMDQDAEAARRLEALLADGGDDPAVHANLAACYLGMQDMARAQAAARRAADGAPQHPGIQLIHAAVLQAGPTRGAALDLLQRIVDQHPDHVGARYALITALSNDDPDTHRERLCAEYDELLRRTPHNLAGLLAAAGLQAQSGNLEHAAVFYNRAVAIIETPPPLITAAVAKFPDAVRERRQAEVVRTITLTRNLLRQSDRFRADILELGPAGGGVRAMVAHPVRPISADPAEAIAATVAFEDMTQRWLPAPFDVVDVVVGSVTPDRRPAVVLLNPAHPPRLFVWGTEGFVDGTAAAGLATAPATAQAAFVDLNNDRAFDLVLMSADGPRVYRATGPGTFVDATMESGVGAARGWRGLEPVDFDHDGDLDVLAWRTDGWALWRNDGEGRLQAVPLPGLPDLSDIRTVAALDLDDDGDIDLAVTVQQGPQRTLRCFSNQRLARFDEVPASTLGAMAQLTADPLFEDLDNDGWLEVVDVGAPRCTTIGVDFATRGGPPIGVRGASAAAGDFDNDGRLDVVALAGDGTATVPGVALTADATVRVADVDFDGRLDLIASTGQVFRNVTQGAGGWLRVGLSALITGDSKFNAFGLGSALEIRAGRHYQKRMARGATTHFGLGPARHADVLRVLWPNGNYQNLEFRASDRMRLAADQTVIEEQSLKGSCPYLYAWNGERFVFVTDVLWRSALGMALGTGVVGHHATADDYFKISAEQLVPMDGAYVLQFTEELWETSYFDYTRLLVVDHPATGDVYVDEKCVPPPYPPFDIHAVRTPRPLLAAVDHRGRDLRAALSARDQRYVTGYQPTRYQGLVEDTTLTLDLGPFAAEDQVKLYLNGWLWPTDASVNVAVSQNPTVHSQPPTLSVIGEDGAWQTLEMAAGFPSGKNKTMVLDLTGQWPTADHRLRISTNFAIFWDHMFFTVGPQPLELRVTELPIASADLHVRGYSHEVREVRDGPLIPDYDAPDPRRHWRDLVGRYTRCGDVTPLLTAVDDRYAIVGAGDEVTLRFDATAVPDLPPGWRRDFVIHTDGWLKDGDLNSATGKTVGPLPFHGMSAFPYDVDQAYPDGAGDRAFQTQYNTRERNQRPFREWLRGPD